MRERLPNRRLHITAEVEYVDIFAFGQPMKFEIAYGFDDNYILKEVFVASRSHPLSALINDICILLSTLMQHGARIEAIAESLGENRNEGESAGLPSSFIGALARHGVRIQQEILEQT